MILISTGATLAPSEIFIFMHDEELYKAFNQTRLKYIWNVLDPKKADQTPEKIVEQKLVEYFGQWFDVTPQYYADKETWKKNCRVDILMYHKKDKLRVPVVIEIKKDSIKSGNSLADWCKQAGVYATRLFAEKTPVVLIFPQVTGIYLEEGALISPHNAATMRDHNVNSFLYGAFGIGEIRKFSYSNGDFYCFIINNREVWNSRDPFVFKSHIL